MIIVINESAGYQKVGQRLRFQPTHGANVGLISWIVKADQICLQLLSFQQTTLNPSARNRGPAFFC